ncbi:MAG: S8 family serine peptidase [Chloroflexota bacterium]|nr:S8 family serine peptidase [Chloroflexota bacterium]
MESVIMGIEHVIAKHEEAVAAGLPNEDPMYPQAMNLSLGTPDDDDPDNPIRAAVLAAFQRPIGIYAAAGNGGPSPGTILLPASMEEVWATGAITLDPFYIWPQSSRGPTREGLVKPDMVFYGVNILTASAKGDADFEVKAGTSFSSPLLAAGGGLWMEALNRAGLQTREQKYAGIHPRALLPLLALACRKPQDAPIAMDNAYGVGQPFGDLAGRLVSGAGAGAAGAMMEPVTQIMTFGMVATLMSGFMRSLRAGA